MARPDRPAADAPKLVTGAELRAQLNVSPRTLTRLVQSGLPRYRLTGNVVRYDPREVAAWVEQHREVAS